MNYDQKAMENLAIELTKTNCKEYMAAYKMRLRYQLKMQRDTGRKKRRKNNDSGKRKLEEKLAKEKGLENEIKNGIARLIIEGDTEEFLMILRKKVEEELRDAGWKI